MDDKVLVIKRIHITYHLQVEPGVDREALDRAYRGHPRYCPVYRSIHPQIEVTTALDPCAGPRPSIG